MMARSDQGVTLERYMLIPRVLVFLTRGNSVLLLKGAPTKRLWANLYNGVGGHIERSEDVLTAAQRELLEETGLIADLHLCGTLIVDTGENPGIGLFIFSGECEYGEPKTSQEGTLEWIPFDKIFGLPIVEDVEILLQKIKEMDPNDPPFAARSFYDEGGKLTMVLHPV